MKPVVGAQRTAAPTLAAQLQAEAELLQRELDEIGLLLRQVRTEAERHRARRQQTAERFEALLNETGADSALREAHAQLMLQAQRAVLMDAQVEVLEGKLKVLQRFAAHVNTVQEDHRSAGAATAPGHDASGRAGADESDPRSILAGQEDMRRQIARQMHDGPAQSIANIALQAEVVQRLLLSDAGAGESELAQLRQMVQHALEETKNFIFDVRPMVLDDLGLVPTLRRAANDRARRTERRIRFESVGADRRLSAEVESALFRIVDDAVTGFIAADAEEVSVRLNWTEEELTVAVSSYDAGPIARAAAAAEKAPASPAPESLPPALAAMIQEQRHREEQALSAGLPEATFAAIEARAVTVGISVALEDDGRALTVRAQPT